MAENPIRLRYLSRGPEPGAAALDPVLQRFGATTDPFSLRALSRLVEVLPAELTGAQAQQALNPLLQLIS